MVKMKASRPKDGDGGAQSDVSAADATCTPTAELRASTPRKDRRSKEIADMPPPSKSPSVDKNYRKPATKRTCSTLATTKKVRGEDKFLYKKGDMEVRRSGNSESGTLAGAAPAVSKADDDSDFQEEPTPAPSQRKRQRKRDSKVDRDFTEEECHHQLVVLRADDKRPPPTINAETFASKFGLHNNGINTHRMKIGKDITKEAVEEVWGKEKSRNGFLVAEKLSKELKKAMERLYCVCYQKTHLPTHVAKEFAVGIVLDKVQKKEVNWAEFAEETNSNQRKSYCRRLKIWIHGLAELKKRPFREVYVSEGFADYIDGEVEKSAMANTQCLFWGADATAEDTKPLAYIPSNCSQDTEITSLRLTEVTKLTEALQTKVKCLDEEIMKLKANFAHEELQHEACSHLVQQIQTSLSEAGQECSVSIGSEEIPLAISKAELQAIFKMFYSNVKKLEAYSAAMALSKDKICDKEAHKRATASCLVDLQAYSTQLSGGTDTALMRPLPQSNSDVLEGRFKEDVLLRSTMVCCICCEAFPSWDFILSVCQHAYHPWCASRWFHRNVTCAVPLCGSVSRQWYMSFGFVDYDNIAAEQKQGFTIEAVGDASPITAVVTPKPLAASSNIHLGAPSRSATGSTLSKSLHAGLVEREPETKEDSAGKKTRRCPTVKNVEEEGNENPFASQLSAPQRNEDQCCTATSPVGRSAARLASADAIVLEKTPESTAPLESAHKDAVMTDVVRSLGPNWRDRNAEVDFNMDADDPLLKDSPPSRVAPVLQLEEDMDMGDECNVSLQAATAEANVQTPDPLCTPILNTVAATDTALPDEKQGKDNADDPYSLSPVHLKEKTKARDRDVTESLSQVVVTSDQNDRRTALHASNLSSKDSEKTTPKAAADKGARCEAPPPETEPMRILRSRPNTARGADDTPSLATTAALGSRTRKGGPGVLHLDLTKGIETVAIPVHEGDSSDDTPTFDLSFTYVRSFQIHSSVTMVGRSPMCHSGIQESNQLPESSVHMVGKCVCLSGGEGMPYLNTGLLHPRFIKEFQRIRRGSTKSLVHCSGIRQCPESDDGECPGHVSKSFIQECNTTCGCIPTCPTRIVQNGPTTKLQVFFVNKQKGWGIRTLQYLKPGCFLFEYAGEVVTNAELLMREDHTKFSLSLTADWQSEATKDDSTLLCIDSTVVTNVARWMNHRCGDANVMDMPVWVDCSSPVLYHVAFFANQLIYPGEELTWDYGLTFEEEENTFSCYCGSAHCRGQ